MSYFLKKPATWTKIATIKVVITFQRVVKNLEQKTRIKYYEKSKKFLLLLFSRKTVVL